MRRLRITSAAPVLFSIALVGWVHETSTFAQLVPADPVYATVLENAPIFLVPDASRTPLRVVAVGTTLEVLGVQDSWVNVSFKDPQFGPRIGFVEARLIQLPPPASPRQTRASVPAAPPEISAPVAEEPRIKTTLAPLPQTAPPLPPPTLQRDGTQTAPLKATKIRGYVTAFRSPTDFDIEDYRITRDQAFSLDFENASPDVVFQLSDIRVGVELEIKGQLNEQTGDLKATAIKVDLEQFRSIKQTAFVSRAPEGIQRLDGSWVGELRADGQIIRVTNATKVVFKPTKRERKMAANRKQNARMAEEDAEPLKALDQVSVGMAMTYEGKRDRETGKVIAERIEFATNDLEDGEAKLWKSLQPSVKDAKGLRPGELKINHVGKYKLVPDQEVQAYVAALGQRLIPQYQRDLSIDDPRRIPFHFYVVVNNQVNAFATPNGIVVVNSGLIDMLENEAQLAAVMGHEIAHATHEHTWREQQFHKKTRAGIAIAGAVASAYRMRRLGDLANMVNGAIVNGHSRAMENQSDRIGLEYMVAAGYDPRQAPAVWKLMAKTNGVHSTNFFWSSHDNEPTRRSYLMNELKNNYRDLDFAPLAINAAEYLRIKAALASASGTKKKIRVK
jgi:hypothetical protein